MRVAFFELWHQIIIDLSDNGFDGR